MCYNNQIQTFSPTKHLLIMFEQYNANWGTPQSWCSRRAQNLAECFFFGMDESGEAKLKDTHGPIFYFNSLSSTFEQEMPWNHVLQATACYAVLSICRVQ